MIGGLGGVVWGRGQGGWNIWNGSEAARRWGSCGLWRGLLGEAREEATATIQPEVMAAWIQVQVRELSGV